MPSSDETPTQGAAPPQDGAAASGAPASEHEPLQDLLRERDRRLADALGEVARAREALQQSQKMEAIGSLASGVAHDFNNLLTLISGLSELLLRRGLPEDQRAHVEGIARAARQGGELTRRLLSFARKRGPQPTIVDLNGVVTEMGKLLRRAIGEDVDLVTHLAATPLRVRADPAQIEQILMNLAVNARDAMQSGGRLTIETRRSGPVNPGAVWERAAEQGPFAVLAVTDTGCGMTAETVARVFEPFFTTKAAGKGTGLGLSVVYGIVQQNGGHISVASEPGRGSSFSVFLPEFKGELQESVGLAPPDLPAGLNCLWVEDDDELRHLIAAFLVEAGHKVELAKDGPEAIEVLLGRQAEGRPFDVVITDLVMPGCSGREVLRAVRSGSPSTAVVIVTGYPDHALRADESESEVVQAKPFTRDALLAAMAKSVARCRARQREPSKTDQAPAPQVDAVTPPASRQRPRGSLDKVSGMIEAEGPGEQPGATPTSRALARVLVVEDDPAVRQIVVGVVQASQCHALGLSSGEEAIEEAPSFCPDILLVDYRMPGLNGLQTIERIRLVVPECLAIVLTGVADLEVTTEALRLSAFDLLRKPLSSEELQGSLRRAVAYRETQRRERRQRDFLSILSHGLRSPLQAPLRYLGNLLAGTYGPMAEPQRQKIVRIAQGVATEARLVSNLLDLSYLEAGRFSVRPVPCSLAEVVQEIVSSFETLAADEKVDLRWSPSGDAVVCPLDSAQIKQAIGNILCNAIEHASGKSVEVSVGVEAGMAHCTVRDDGSGIAQPHLQRIFERDYQVPSLPSRRQGGLGIGLYIARQIVEAHGGRISVTSTLGKGSVFTVSVPAS